MPFLALKLLEIVFILLIDVKIPTIVGILTIMSRIDFKFSGVEHEKSCITSRPDCTSKNWENGLPFALKAI